MDKKILIWKIIKDAYLEKHLEASCERKEERYYNLSEVDLQKSIDIEKGMYGTVFIFVGTNIETVYLIEILRIEEEKFYYQALQRIKDNVIVEDLKRYFELDINNDFDKGSYVVVEQSVDGYKQIKNLILEPYILERNGNQSYEKIMQERHLHALSQRNEYCEREYGVMNSDPERGEFQRDHDRIVHSKAFRRMVDKAQIFTASKGDYYRTRMTHTLTVGQIAKGICNALYLNTYLTEAIALGHDLGHTPFGHQGERTLDSILKRYNTELDMEIRYGGFKHNYQTLRTVCFLEEEYIEHDGLDLSFQTLEGLWKHTKTKYDTGEYELSEFFNADLIKYLYPNEVISTLEGQIVYMADEIAQRGHDLDDAFSAKLITMDDLKSYLSLHKMKSLYDEICISEKKIDDYLKMNRIYSNEQEMKQNRAVSVIISYFIKEVIKESRKQMENYDKDKFEADEHRVKTRVIKFSKKGEMICSYLEKIISKKVINSLEVALFDEHASKIITGLFEAYYSNPQLLHKGTLKRIYRDFRNITTSVLDFQNSDSKLVKAEWQKITTFKDADGKEMKGSELDEYRFKRKILVRNICDFIGGMTDSYAKAEYQHIYKLY